MRVFGSYLREQQDDNSDRDFPVEFPEPAGFFAFLNVEEYLEELL
jgi:predicted nucleotidyltransferase